MSGPPGRIVGMNRRQFLLAGTGGVVALATRPPAGAGAVVDTPLVLVTADTESHVAVVNPATGRTVRRIDTLRLPRSIERVGGTAVVAHSELGRITLIDQDDLSTRALIGRLGEPRLGDVGRPRRRGHLRHGEPAAAPGPGCRRATSAHRVQRIRPRRLRRERHRRHDARSRPGRQVAADQPDAGGAGKRDARRRSLVAPSLERGTLCVSTAPVGCSGPCRSPRPRTTPA